MPKGEEAQGLDKEITILDFQSHQHRLMPLLASAYAYHFQVTLFLHHGSHL